MSNDALRLPDYLDHMQQAVIMSLINLEVVWETVQTALPKLLAQLPRVRLDAASQDQAPEST
jgi:uncharacterized protein with HEPN domain